MSSDLSDLLVEIQVYFKILRFHLPEQDWGWNHPVLRQWMDDRGLKNPYWLDEKALKILLKSLKRKHREVSSSNEQ